MPGTCASEMSLEQAFQVVGLTGVDGSIGAPE
jgi:hypothetical protein